MRTILYNYHRLGLDLMYNDDKGGRAMILACVKQLEKLYDENPNSVWLSVFFAAKADEMANIFAGGTPQEKQLAYQILTKCDPLNVNRYKKITGAK
jgi:hypothetical protein